MIHPDWIKLGKVYPGAKFQDNDHDEWQIIIISVINSNWLRASYPNCAGSEGNIALETLNHCYHPLDAVRKYHLTTLKV